jgi:hypothetical protein
MHAPFVALPPLNPFNPGHQVLLGRLNKFLNARRAREAAPVLSSAGHVRQPIPLDPETLDFAFGRGFATGLRLPQHDAFRGHARL